VARPSEALMQLADKELKALLHAHAHSLNAKQLADTNVPEPKSLVQAVSTKLIVKHRSERSLSVTAAVNVVRRMIAEIAIDAMKATPSTLTQRLITPEHARQVIQLEDALQKMEGIDPWQARLVELYFYGGLNQVEAGNALGSNPETLNEDWRLAKAWLKRMLR
jgi:DNA-directed RNA polymerase specialized sigma24 family protein